MQQTGIATRQQLFQEGWDRARLAAALQTGEVNPIRRGYFSLRGAPADLVKAVRVGGAATGPTALRWYGLWAPPDDRVHVLVPANAGRLREVDDTVVVHWASSRYVPRRGPLNFRPVVPLEVALEHAMSGVPPEFAVAIGDSALHERRISAAALDALVAELPRRVIRAVARRFDGKSESGIESITRYLLSCAGIDAQIQVLIDGVGRVDLLINGWLIVELDGGQHASVPQMRKDRLRDSAAVRLGYRTLRFSYNDVMFGWAAMLETIQVMLADGAPLGLRVS